MPKICAIMPAYNEELTIGTMVILTKKYADKIIVIDDGSDDRTSELARAAGAEIITHSVNKGKGVALKTGFEAAKNCDIIVTIDADGQHDPREIPQLVKPIIDGEADVVNGSRYLERIRHTPFYRRIGQKILDFVTNIDSNVKFTDTQSGFRAFNANIITAFKFSEIGFAVESEMLQDASNAGLKVKEVPIGVRYDVNGSTLNPIHHGISVLLKILNNIEYKKPLVYFTIPGIFLSLTGLAIGLYFLQQFTEGKGVHLGPTALMILMTLVGIYLTFTGIILHTISTLFKEGFSKKL